MESVYQSVEIFKNKSIFGDWADGLYPAVRSCFGTHEIFSCFPEENASIYLQVLGEIKAPIVITKNGRGIEFMNANVDGKPVVTNIVSADIDAIYARLIAALRTDPYLCFDKSCGLLRDWQEPILVSAHFVLKLLLDGRLTIDQAAGLMIGTHEWKVYRSLGNPHDCVISGSRSWSWPARLSLPALANERE